MVWEMSVEFQGHHPLLWRSSQHWRDEYPTPQTDTHCKGSMPADAQCYVFCHGYDGYVILFLKRIKIIQA